MKRPLFALCALLAGLGPALLAQSDPTYIPLGPAKGALYRPDQGPAPHVAILVAHRSANFMNHIATRELSRRGFLVLGMNPRFENNEPNVIFEDVSLDVKAAVAFVRKQPGITKIVLLGHSGGGATMSFYQAVAEKGPAAARGAGKFVQGDEKALAGFPPADGLILVDAHPGVSVNFLRALDPRVIDESDPRTLDASLDPFDPAHGYNPNGPSAYSEEFKTRYHKAQSDRLNRLIDRALTLSKRMAAGEHLYRDNDYFLVPRGSGGGLKGRDLSILDTTAQPRRLLMNDGTVVTRVIRSVREPEAGSAGADRGGAAGLPFSSARLFTVRSFLSTIAVRSTNSIDGIDWASSNNSVPNNVRSVSVPLLVAAMGAYSFIRDNEIHYEMAASRDKEFIVVEGATHDMVPLRPKDGDPDRYANATKNFFDHVAAWIRARF
jgi:pimeloyl-ACP methyl ester carboxylesterase